MTAAPDSSYPLSWPAGWPRASARARAKFGQSRQSDYGNWRTKDKLTIGAALERLLDELRRLGAASVVVSSNVPTRLDGMPYSRAAEPADPGAAVYFRLKGEPRVLACDKWDRVADNIAALAAHIEAARGQARWGVGSLEQAFAGYKALPAMGPRRPWHEILGVPPHASMKQVFEARDRLLLRHHPDRGGSHSMAAEINSAVTEARAELGA